MTTKFPVCYDRMVFCQGRCQRITLHQRKDWPEMATLYCMECGKRTLIVYPQKDELPLINYYVDQLNYIAEGMNNILNSLMSHKWSVNLGSKDKRCVEQLRDDLVYMLRKVNEAEGVPKPGPEDLEGIE